MRKIDTASAFTAVVALASIICASTALAQTSTLPAPVAPAKQTESALDKAVANMPIEKLLAQLLGGIDFNALSVGMEQAAKDVAEGKQPELAKTPALQDMQAKLQKQFGIVGPELMKTMLAVMGPLLAELKNDISKELGPEAAPAR